MIKNYPYYLSSRMIFLRRTLSSLIEIQSGKTSSPMSIESLSSFPFWNL